MSALVLLIAVSLALSTLFVAACILSIRSGQFDDMESPKWRVCFSDVWEPLPPIPNFETKLISRVE